MDPHDERLVLLQQIELFHGIDTADLHHIARQMTEQSYAEGEIVFRESEPGLTTWCTTSDEIF